MKITKAKKKLVSDIVDEMKETMKLQRFTIYTFYYDKPRDNEGGIASMKTDFAYLTCTLSIYADFWDRECSDQQREDVLIHEMSHVITAKMHKNVYDMHDGVFITPKQFMEDWESATEHIKNIICDLR